MKLYLKIDKLWSWNPFTTILNLYSPLVDLRACIRLCHHHWMRRVQFGHDVRSWSQLHCQLYLGARTAASAASRNAGVFFGDSSVSLIMRGAIYIASFSENIHTTFCEHFFCLRYIHALVDLPDFRSASKLFILKMIRKFSSHDSVCTSPVYGPNLNLPFNKFLFSFNGLKFDKIHSIEIIFNVHSQKYIQCVCIWPPQN